MEAISVRFKMIFLVFLLGYGQVESALARDRYVNTSLTLDSLSTLFNKKDYNRVITVGEHLISTISDIDTTLITQQKQLASSFALINTDFSFAALFLATPTGWITMGLLAAGDAMDTVDQSSKSWREFLARDLGDPMTKYMSPAESRDLYRYLGLSYYRTNEFEKAAQYLSRYIDTEEKFRLTIARQDRRIGYTSKYTHDIQYLIDSLVNVKQYAEAVSYMELSKAKTFSESIMQSVYSKTEKGLVRGIHKLKYIIEADAIRDDAPHNLESKGSRGIKVLQKKIESNPEKNFLLTTSLTINRPLKNDFLIFQERTAFVTYYLADEKIFMGVVNGGKINCISSPIDNEDLVDYISSYNLKRREEKEKSRSELYKILFSPLLEKNLLKDVDSVLISTHGIINNLSFSGLRDKNQGPLIANYNIGYTPSLCVYYLQKSAQNKFVSSVSKEDRGVLIGNVRNTLYNGVDLPWTSYEIDEVGQILGEDGLIVNKLTGERATENAVIGSLKNASFVHFATHSYFNSAHPDESSILLSNLDTDDGLLMASELYNRLTFNRKLQLIYLSSCSSGNSTSLAGGDPFGLNRSFVLLGAKNIIDTVREVSDKQAAEIAIKFYRKKQEGLDLFSAFNESIRSFTDQKDDTWAYYKFNGLIK